MKQRVKWASGQASRWNETIGPRHDPYGRTIVDVFINGRNFRLVRCGLAGDWIEDDRGERFSMPATIFGSVQRLVADETYDAKVEEWTGYPPRFWFDELWERVEAARHRNIPGYAEMLEAEAEMGRGAY